MATGVILNPWWEVPTSISKEVAGKPGYVAVKGKDGKVQRWRQPPGPSNALGQLKFVMLQPVQYLSSRHQCPEPVQQPDPRACRMAASAPSMSLTWRPSCWATTMANGRRKRSRRRWQSKKTVQANFVKPVPVYIVYFSVAALTDGTIVNYTDLYKRDNEVIAALLDGEGKARRSRRKRSPRISWRLLIKIKGGPSRGRPY